MHKQVDEQTIKYAVALGEVTEILEKAVTVLDEYVANSMVDNWGDPVGPAMDSPTVNDLFWRIYRLQGDCNKIVATIMD